MDIETLTKAIELIRSLGGDAKEAFIWWLIVGNAHYYLFGLIWSAIGGVAILKGINCLMKIPLDTQKLERLRESTGVGRYYFGGDELNIACETLSKYYRKVKAEHDE